MINAHVSLDFIDTEIKATSVGSGSVWSDDLVALTGVWRSDGPAGASPLKNVTTSQAENQSQSGQRGRSGVT